MSDPAWMVIGRVTVCPMNAPCSGDPVAPPMSTSYWAGAKFALTLSVADGRVVMRVEFGQAAVAVSVTGRKELPFSVATPAPLTETTSESDEANAKYELGANHALCVPDTASTNWVPSLKVTATTKGLVVPTRPPKVFEVKLVV